MKTYTPKASEIQRSWHVLDASGKILGRLATEAARLLRGKHKPIYAPHADVGDFVIIVNAAKVRVTGKKAEQKIYYWHTQYPGGLKSVNFAKLLQTHPERVIRHAVKGMLPHNPLGRAMLRRLKVYPGDAHPHQAQLSAQAKKSQERSER
jgi:large subunit ribosomal protein L13